MMNALIFHKNNRVPQHGMLEKYVNIKLYAIAFECLTVVRVRGILVIRLSWNIW